VNRRTFLAGGLGALGLAAAGCSSSLPAGVPTISPGSLVSGSFVSRKRGGTQTGWSIAYPPGHDPGAALPVLVALHERGGDHTKPFGGSLHLDRFLAQAVHDGVRPYAIAAADGGDHEYWHPRRGTDPAGMIVDEFLPMLAARGLRTDRIGLFGWSMGGYGTLYLAGALRARRVAVAVAESPAIWHHGSQSVEGAFDDAADFHAHRIFGRQRRLRGIALRIDCGAADGFAPTVRDLRASISPTPAGGIEPGGHDERYWRSQAPAQLRFVGRRLG
jgi:enterochelin esterase-like enzyme